jgi:hypothetical protein
MTADERYQPVRDTLPAECPPITRYEAARAYPRLYFQLLSRAGKAPRAMELRVRRCWISSKPTRGVNKGWQRLVHDVSHQAFRELYPHKRPHDPLHAHYEQQAAAYVMAKGWLDGKMQAKPKAPKRKPAKPTTADKLAKQLQALARWEQKAERAARRCAKLRRSVAALQRHASKQGACDE